MSDILISIGLTGAADVQKALNQFVKDANKSLAGLAMPDLSALSAKLPKVKPQVDNSAFDATKANLSELQKELSKLQKQFTSGSDLTGIKALQAQIAALKAEIKGTPALSEKIKGEGKVKLDLSSFNVATAKMSELKAALSQLKANLVVGGDTSQIKAVQAQIKLLNDSLKDVSTKAVKPKIDLSTFDIANASVKDLKAALSQLQANFKVGGDTSQIQAIIARLKEAKAEMSGQPNMSFTDRLKAAFKEAAGGLFDFKQRILEIASGNILANLFQQLGSGIVQAGKYAINSAAQFESIGASLNVMTGSVEKGQMVFSQFQQLASKSPFNFDDVAEQGSKLLAMGIPIKDITDRLSRIGDVAAGVGREKLPSIVYAYGQIKSAGKAMAGDISQFINAGVPIIENLAEVMGKPESAIKQLASAGKIGFAEIDAALLNMTNSGGTFFGMMQAQSNTFEGLWSSMQDSFQVLAGTIGQKLLPLAKSLTVAITNAVGSVGEFLNGTKSLADSDVPFLKVLSAVGKVASAFINPAYESVSVAFEIISRNLDTLSIGLQIGAAAFLAYGAQIAIVKGIALAHNAATLIGMGLDKAGAVARGIYTVASQGLAAAMGTATAQTAAHTLASRANAAAQAAMWLVSNPVGWALLAAGAVAATAAYFAFSKESEAVRRSNEAMSSLTSGLTEKYKEERIQIDGLFSILKDTKPSEAQAKAYQNLSKNLGDVTTKYSLEKDLLGQTEKQGQKKAAQQEKAAHKIIELYGKEYGAELNMQVLLAKGAAADATRLRLQEKLRKDKLNSIAEEFAAETKLQAFKDIFAAETGKVLTENKERAELYAAQSAGFFSSLMGGLKQFGREGFNGISSTIEEFNSQSADAKAKMDILSDPQKLNQLKDAVNNVFKGQDLSGLFDAKDALKGTEQAANAAIGSLADLKAKLSEAEKVRETSVGSAFKAASKDVESLKKQIETLENSTKGVEFAPNSLKALNEQLSAVNAEIEKVNPNSKAFEAGASKARTLEKEISAIQDRLKASDYSKGSLADLNEQLGKANEQIEKVNPNSKAFTQAASEAKELDLQIANIREKLEGSSFEMGSLDAMDKELSKLRENLGKLAPSSDSFVTTATKAQILETKIASLNLEISNIGKAANSISVLQSKLQSVQETISITDSDNVAFAGLLDQSKALSSQIELIQNKTELGLLNKGSLEYAEKQLSILQDSLKGAFDENVIRATNLEIEKLNSEITNTKIKLGKIGGVGSFEAMDREISKLQDSFNKATNSAQRFVLSSKIEALKQLKEAAENASKSIEKLDLSKISPDTAKPFSRQLAFEGKIETISWGSSLQNMQPLEIPKLEPEKLSESTLMLSQFGLNLRLLGADLLSFKDEFGKTISGSTMGIDLLESSMGKISEALVTKFGYPLDIANQKAIEWGRNISELFKKVGEDMLKAIADGIGNATFAFAEGIGEMIVGTGSMADAWGAAKEAIIGTLFAMADALLVQVPKVLGFGLLQSAFTPVALATFPANLPLAAAGLALIGASGLMSGILKGLQKKREAAKEEAKIPSTRDLATQDSLQTQSQTKQALGASAYNAEKPLLLATINITTYQTGISGEIMSEAQRQFEIRQELK